MTSVLARGGPDPRYGPHTPCVAPSSTTPPQHLASTVKCVLSSLAGGGVMLMHGSRVGIDTPLHNTGVPRVLSQVVRRLLLLLYSRYKS